MKRISWILSVFFIAGLAGCGDENELYIGSAYDNDKTQSGADRDKNDGSGTGNKGDKKAQDDSDEQGDGSSSEDEKGSESNTGSGSQTENGSGSQTENGSGSQTENGSGNQNNTDTEPDTETQPIQDACGNSCNADETCQADGSCLKNCDSGLARCGSECWDFDALHLSSCSECSADYCDSDGNVANGCDIFVKGNDSSNCGACGNTCSPDSICLEGSCMSRCSAGAEWCNEECIKLNELHMASCNVCEASYCDADGNMANGCETYALGDDPNNCGACGNRCDGACQAGQCVKAFRAMSMGNLTLTANADGSGGSTGSTSLYDYVQVLDVSGDKSKVSFNGNVGWVSSSSLMDACDENCPSRKAIDLAEKYLYTKHDHLCTFDFLSHEPHLDNFTDLSPLDNQGYDTNHGYDLNCANFVTAILISSGLFTTKTSVVGTTRDYGVANDSYRYLNDFSQAKPGDIWTCGDQHAELVVGYHDGNLVLIGSNNFWYGDGYNNCVNTYSTDETSYQRVSYGTNKYCSKTQYVVTRQ